MPFSFEKAPLNGAFLIEPKVFPDERGAFMELYHQAAFDGVLPGIRFVQDNVSRSTRGVLRGLHHQLPPAAQGKLVTVLEGEVWDVGVDLRPDSPTKGTWWGVALSGRDPRLVFWPAGCAHGFLTLSEEALLLYRCTAVYTPQAESGIRWDDPALDLPWPLHGEEPLLSPRDGALPDLPSALALWAAAEGQGG